MFHENSVNIILPNSVAYAAGDVLYAFLKFDHGLCAAGVYVVFENSVNIILP